MGEGEASARTILIVDDDLATRDLLQEVFRDEGFVTIVCRDLADATRYLERYGAPDIGLIDFSLPDGLGTDLCEQLRLRNVPCLIVSAYPTWLGDAVYRKPGWISKPFVVEELVAAVRERLTEGAGARTPGTSTPRVPERERPAAAG